MSSGLEQELQERVHLVKLGDLKVLTPMPEILSRRYIGLEATIDNIPAIADIFFEKEKSKYDLDGPMEGSYLWIKTDSSRRSLRPDIYKSLLLVKLDEWKYGEEEKASLAVCLSEVYANAIIFGSKTGSKRDYTKRNKTPPSTKERARNKRKSISLEFLITAQYILTRVTDTGEGIKQEEYDTQVKKYTTIPKNFQDLPKEEQSKYFNVHGRGLFMVEGDTGHPLVFNKTNAFSTSFIIYRKKEELAN